uniref:Orf 1 protein n=1 Tax=Homo sapiens TaxID=9606 RepID=V9H1I3_HUMAN|nr:hypothetical protein 1 - human [Homo sapiens]CAA58678.1 orf 1 [Homo sapiens]
MVRCLSWASGTPFPRSFMRC